MKQMFNERRESDREDGGEEIAKIELSNGNNKQFNNGTK